MNKRISGLIFIVVLSMSAFSQQKSPDSSSVVSTDSIQVSSSTDQKNLSKQVAIYRPKTVTNWSKIKDLFR